MSADPQAATPPPTEYTPFNRVKDCRYGRMLYNVNDIYVGRSFELYGEYSEGEVGLFRQVLRPGDVAIDVGANIGAHTVFFARAVGPTGAVLAFEPQRLAYQALCANAALNSFPNVWCFQTALAEAPGRVPVPVLDPYRPHNFGGFEVGRHPHGEPVPVARLDSYPVNACRLIKIDVEGMELRVLKGASGLIERFRPALYVENDRFDRSAGLLGYLDSIGYEAYRHHTPLYNPDNFLKNPENVFGRIVSANLYCLHKDVKKDVRGYERVQAPEVK